MTEKTKRTLSIVAWVAGIVVAAAGHCFIFIAAFMVTWSYPYGFIIFGLYLILTVLFPILYWKYRKKAFKVVSFILFYLSIVPLLATLVITWISVATGRI